MPKPLMLVGVSVYAIRVRVMTTSTGSKRESKQNSGPMPWNKQAHQVYALYGGKDGPIVFMPDGATDLPAPCEPSRTFRDLATAGELWCPVENCEPFKTVVQGEEKRSHFRHKSGAKADDVLHSGGPESVWHLQAKFAIYEWIAGAAASPIRELAIEYKDLPRLRDGRARRQPDVYVEFEGGARVAFECQLQSMGGTSRENTATHHDGRAEWRRRLDDCRELRDEHGINVIWIVSPWMSKGTPRLTEPNVWELKCFRTWAAGMLSEGAQLYWLDPTFGQIGTLVDRIARNGDGRGFLTPARDFPYRHKHHWLYSDLLIDCKIDPCTGTMTTPTDRVVERQRPFAERRRRIEAEREAAAEQELQQMLDNAAARVKADQERYERDRLVRQQAAEENRRQLAARRERAAAEAKEKQEARAAELQNTAMNCVCALAVVLIIAIVVAAAF
jgi:hypothetical protein